MERLSSCAKDANSVIISSPLSSSVLMCTALEKHKKKFLRLIDKYSQIGDVHHIHREAKRAFMAIKQYYAGEIAAESIKREIESSVMIGRRNSPSEMV